MTEPISEISPKPTLRKAPDFSVADDNFLDLVLGKRSIDTNQIGDVKANILRSNDVYFNRIGGKSEAIGFRYTDGSIKWRATSSKDFSQTGVCRDLYPQFPEDPSGTVVIVEGEFDSIAMRSCGLEAYSVPKGANISGDAPPDFLKPVLTALEEGKIDVIVAVDSDDKGQKFASKLMDYLGRKRVGAIDWSKYGVKDANEALMVHGPSIMNTALSEVKNILYEGIIRASSVTKYIDDLRTGGFKGGSKVGLNSIDNLYTICSDQVTVVTGVPGSGKSELIDYFMVSLAMKEEWKFAIFSAENPIEIHAGKLIEKFSGRPIFEGSNKINEEDLIDAACWLDDHFFFLDSSSSNTIDSILARAEVLVENEKINGLLIDPFNYTDVSLETDAISAMLTKLHAFAKKFHIHIWIVAHPQKMYRGDGGKIPVPNGGDISGSAAWWAKADFGLTVSRDEDGGTVLTVWKCRFKWLGEVGSCHLRYDRTCGRYTDGESSSDIAATIQEILGDDPDAGGKDEEEWQEEDCWLEGLSPADRSGNG
jgi:twinkle protein